MASSSERRSRRCAWSSGGVRSAFRTPAASGLMVVTATIILTAALSAGSPRAGPSRTTRKRLHHASCRTSPTTSPVRLTLVVSAMTGSRERPLSIRVVERSIWLRSLTGSMKTQRRPAQHSSRRRAAALPGRCASSIAYPDRPARRAVGRACCRAPPPALWGTSARGPAGAGLLPSHAARAGGRVRQPARCDQLDRSRLDEMPGPASMAGALAPPNSARSVTFPA